MIDRFEHFYFAANEISKFIKKITTEEMMKHGLKSSHALYFSLLSSNHPQGLTATQLCEYSGRDKADASRMLALMEEKGLVTKTGEHQNHYNGLYRLTDDGLRIADYVRERAEAAVEFAGKDLTDEQRESFYVSLDSIVSNLRELTQKGLPES